MSTGGPISREPAARRRSFLLAATGGVCFGVTVLFSRIVARDGLGPLTALTIRFSLAGALLIAVLLLTHRPLLPPPGERFRAFALGAVVYAAESTFFFLALERGTAAAVALLFYCYPAVVAVVELTTGDLAPRASLFVAIGLAIGGAAVVAAGGGDVALSATGACFVAGSVVLFSCYALATRRLLRQTDDITAAAWTALGAATTLACIGALTGNLRAPGSDLAPLAGNAVATAAAFTLFFLAVANLGTSRAAVVMTLEAISAVVLTALFLGERITFVELLGGAAILAGAVIAGLLASAPAIDADTAPP